jgi:hypothetical protein
MLHEYLMVHKGCMQNLTSLKTVQIITLWPASVNFALGLKRIQNPRTYVTGIQFYSNTVAVLVSRYSFSTKLGKINRQS